jgi:hypothetical protein
VASIVDVRKVANEILRGGFFEFGQEEAEEEAGLTCYNGKDLFMDGMRVLPTSDKLSRLKNELEAEGWYNYSDDEDFGDSDDDE